jgi:hypothetical protein
MLTRTVISSTQTMKAARNIVPAIHNALGICDVSLAGEAGSKGKARRARSIGIHVMWLPPADIEAFLRVFLVVNIGLRRSKIKKLYKVHRVNIYSI